MNEERRCELDNVRVLVIEPVPLGDDALRAELERCAHRVSVERVQDDEPLARSTDATDAQWDVILCSDVGHGSVGGRVLSRLRDKAIDSAVVVVTDEGRKVDALEAMRCGAKDVVAASDLTRLAPVVAREVMARTRRMRETDVAEATWTSARIIRAAAQDAGHDAQRAAEHRYQSLFDAAITAVAIADVTGRIYDANDTFLAMTGYTREDVDSGTMSWRKMTAPMWMPVSLKAVDELRETNVARPFEKAYTRKDGTFVHVLVSAAMLRDGRILSVAADLSGRKREEAKTSAVLDSALDAVIVMNRAGVVVEFNPAAEKMFGVSRAEALGVAISELVIPADLRSAHHEGFARLVASGREDSEMDRVELRVCHRDGRAFPVEVSLSHFGEKDDLSFVAFVRDITERKHTEADLRTRARAAVLAAEVGLALTGEPPLADLLARCCEAMVTRLDVAEARIWTWNGARSDFDLVARAGASETSEEAFAQHLAELPDTESARASREGAQSYVGYPLVVGDERFGHLALVSTSPLGAVTRQALEPVAGAIALCIRTNRVEEARTALEDQVRQMQKMEAVGRLAGGVAHDFNNLLSVVLSYSELILADLPQEHPQRVDAEEIHRAGTRAADLTRQLLTFSRHQITAPVRLDVNEVLGETNRMLQRLVGERIDLVSTPLALRPLVMADAGSIEQVLMNLVINARDAMPTGGKLLMSTRDVVLDPAYVAEHLGSTVGEHVLLSITDSGSGIDPETVKRMFEPFFTTKEKGKGTGLGLSTVFGIVQRTGGHLRVETEEGVGSTFHVYLPAAASTARAPSPERLSAETQRGSETILLVEDEDQVRLVAREILQRRGYAVLEARGGAEAMALSDEHVGTIHLLVTDVVMPSMIGPELAKILTARRPAMRCLFMSGYTDDASLGSDVGPTAHAYLQKPFTVIGLTEKVRAVLDAET